MCPLIQLRIIGMFKSRKDPINNRMDPIRNSTRSLKYYVSSLVYELKRIYVSELQKNIVY